MKCPHLICMLSLATLMASCTQHAYYQSPFHTNTSSYKTIPVKKAGEGASALYASGAISTGGANDRLKDGEMGFFGSVYKSHTGRVLQGYYGLTCGFGGYNVTRYQPEEPSNGSLYLSHQMNATAINERAGAKFFGGLGAIGGINVVVPFRRGELSIRRFLPHTIKNAGKWCYRHRIN